MRLCLFLLVAGCGRIAFDPLEDSGTGGGSGGGVDAALVCPNVPACPDRMMTVGLGMTMTTEVIGVDHGFSSTMCTAGSTTPEVTVLVMPQRTGNYTATAFGAFSTIYVQDGCCGGPEVKCGLSSVSIQRDAQDPFVVVVEGTANQSVMLQVASF